jgi:hypothetical protein
MRRDANRMDANAKGCDAMRCGSAIDSPAKVRKGFPCSHPASSRSAELGSLDASRKSGLSVVLYGAYGQRQRPCRACHESTASPSGLPSLRVIRTSHQTTEYVGLLTLLPHLDLRLRLCGSNGVPSDRANERTSDLSICLSIYYSHIPSIDARHDILIKSLITPQRFFHTQFPPHNRPHNRQSFVKVLEWHVFDPLFVTILYEVALPIGLHLREKHVGVCGCRQIYIRRGKKVRKYMTGRRSIYHRGAPETPSPKKKRTGGWGSSRYDRIALDLSCPNPLYQSHAYRQSVVHHDDDQQIKFQTALTFRDGETGSPTHHHFPP